MLQKALAIPYVKGCAVLTENDGEADSAGSQQEQVYVWGRSDAQISAVGLAILWSTS